MTNGSERQSATQSELGRERRAFPRYTFIATAEMIERATETHITGRVSEISRKGCFIDVFNTLPKGTVIQLRIATDKASFTSLGHIIYAQERMGVGVAFDGPAADQQKVLDDWLTELSR